MSHMRLVAIVVVGVAMLAGCGGKGGPEGVIEAQVDHLIDALNDHDLAAAGKLYVDGTLPPVTIGGDSSTIYRMIAIPGGSGFEAANVISVVAGDEARTSFNISGKVHHGDSLAGTMTLRLRMELRRAGDEWKFVPGTEVQETL